MLICEQLFGHPVEPRDSFLDLGGSSLTAAKLAARLRREFGAEISLRAILDAPDLGGLAGLLAGSSSPGGPAVLAVPRHAV